MTNANISRNYTSNNRPTSDTTLFSLLIAAFVGGMALCAVAGPPALSTTTDGAVAQAVVAHTNS